MMHIAKGIALLLDETGIITEVIQDSIAFFEDEDPQGTPFTAYLHDNSVKKALILSTGLEKWMPHLTGK